MIAAIKSRVMEMYRALTEGDKFYGGDEWQLSPGLWVKTALRNFQLLPSDAGMYRRRIETPDERPDVGAFCCNEGRVL